MEEPDRGALMLVRFIAVALIAVSVVELALYWVVSSSRHVPLETLPLVLKSIPAVLGLVILIKARAIAEWITDRMDE